MPGSIPVPNPGLDITWKERKIQVAKWGTPKKEKKKTLLKTWKTRKAQGAERKVGEGDIVAPADFNSTTLK